MSGRRLPFVDWLRGIGVVIMIEAHTIDAWTVSDPSVRALTQFKLLQFLAGWAAPLFLWLAGVSVSLAAAAHRIAAAGIRMLVEKQVDYTKSRNLILTSVVLVSGISGAAVKLGTVEMDDMANGVKALWTRPYFDKERVGIFGTSYGGTSSALMILRHPDVIAAASSSTTISPPMSRVSTPSATW